MPHITVKGISESAARALARELKQVVVDAANVKEEYVKVFYSPVQRIDEQNEASVDVYWIHRPQELCDATAERITAFMKEKGQGFVQVTFTEFPPSHFYENNVHY